MSGDVDINATGGILKIQGSLAADQGHLDIGSGATLELGNSAPVGAPISFEGSPATLKLDAPTAFTGTIRDIVVGDEIDLAGITASSASYSGTTLTINETNGQQLIYNNVSGNVAGDTVNVASDNNGGTDVYWGTAPATTTQWISGTAGDWSDAADWSRAWCPTSTDDAVISSSMAVTVNGTAVANSLTLDASILTVSGTLTLGTSLTVDDGAQLTLSGGTLSAQSISSNNNGYLSGYGTVSGAVSGDVDINATGGILKVQGSLAGDQGHFDIGSGTTLELGNVHRRARYLLWESRHAQARRAHRIHGIDKISWLATKLILPGLRRVPRPIAARRLRSTRPTVSSSSTTTSAAA